MDQLKYRCLLVGFGQRAIDDYIPALIPNVLGIELNAICDINFSKKKIVEDIFRDKNLTPPNFYTDFEEAIKSERPDFVIVSTPHSTHLQIAKRLLEAKIPFLKEKPFAMNLSQALELRDLVEKYRGYMRVCVQRRYHPLYVYGKKALIHLRDIRRFEARYQLHANAYYKGWRSTPKESGGGCVMDMGYHYIDLLYWYFGKPKQIFSIKASKNNNNLPYSIEETTLTFFKYRNKMVGQLFLSLCESNKLEELLAFGKYGHIQLQREFLKRFDSNGKIVESLTRTPAWPSAVTDILIDFLNNLYDFSIVQKECVTGIELMEIIDGVYRSINENKLIEID